MTAREHAALWLVALAEAGALAFLLYLNFHLRP